MSSHIQSLLLVQSIIAASVSAHQSIKKRKELEKKKKKKKICPNCGNEITEEVCSHCD